MTDTTAVVLFGAAPIPVGNQVEVFYLSRDVGLFGKDVQAQPEEPAVHDLTTGIWYGRMWHFSPGNEGKLLSARTPDPAPGVQIVSSFRGVVRGCVIATEGHSREQAAASTIHIEVTK